MKNYLKFMAYAFVAMLSLGFVACGDDDDDDDGGSGSNKVTGKMVFDGKSSSITSVQLLQDGSDGDRLWFVVTSDEGVANIFVDPATEGKTIDLSKAAESTKNFWQFTYAATVNAFQSVTHLQGIGTPWGADTYYFNEGSTLTFKSEGGNKYSLSFDIEAPDYHDSSVTHTLKGSWKGKVYNVAAML